MNIILINKFKYLFLTFALFVNNQSVYGQTYLLKGFSNEYYAKVNLISTENNESTISIYNSLNNTNILTVKSESYVIATQLKDSDIYDDKEIILLKDFNFDNHEDFAIETGYSSKGPSYSIFLFKNGKFVLDEVYSCIIQNSQGNFELDKNSKTISTIGNGGCCWHSYSNFFVTNGLPKLMSEIIIENDAAIETKTETIWENGKYVKSIHKTIDLNSEGIVEIMSFNLKNKKRRVVLFNINDRILNYALIDNSNKVEFHYPIEINYKNPDFAISSSTNDLSFVNKGVEYKIYQKKLNNKIAKVGILVNTGNKIVDLEGDINTLNGELSWAEVIDLENVYSKK